ncbi:MAG: IS1634 family transposase [Candidatus Omnitrophica bacterium]|nr:IS1634 family transposase [Candidatus Omnitrophota bacterium]
MYIAENKSVAKTSKKIYQSILLRESYRENGKVKSRTIANLSKCTPNEIAAIKLALKHKDSLSELVPIKQEVVLEEGQSIGAVWCVYQMAKRLGIEKALGNSQMGKLALWQVMARVIDQGSRLSAVRLAQTHAACDILGIEKRFNEDSLYDNLGWLCDNQEKIEQKLFLTRRGKNLPELFLYDVTSSYLEGEKNALADYGYNRDKKKGKKQIVIGLLCDELGEPVSTEVFKGNTQDTETFQSQVQKAVERFGCKTVTMVGDRGMIKKTQIEKMPEGFHYITALTRVQIEGLIKRGLIQVTIFDVSLCEIEEKGIRYMLRRNPWRAEEIEMTRSSKQKKIEQLVEKTNKYLEEHPRAKALKAIERINKKMGLLSIGKWVSISADERSLRVVVDEDALKEEALLDGCYVLKTSLPKESANKEIIHARYKDLSMVESAFRTCKTGHLEIRPVFVRKERNTRGHVLAVMLAYMIVRALQNKWKELDLTVEEGIKQLTTLCSMKVEIQGQESYWKIPIPRKQSRVLLEKLDICLPPVLPHKGINVGTKKSLAKQHKLLENQ